MATTKGFICSSCGKDHEGFPTDRAFTLPDDVWAIPESERSEQATFDRDLCKLGDRYFMRGVLYVPHTFDDQAFGWGVWVEVSEETFFRYIEIYDKDGSQEPSREGKLANALSLYPDADGEELIIRFGRPENRPTLDVLAGSTTSLAVDQRDGMDRARHHQVLHEIGAL